MTLQQMILHIHNTLRWDCFTDIVETTNVAPSTVWKWRKDPPQYPSLEVFSKFALYCGLNPSISQIQELVYRK